MRVSLKSSLQYLTVPCLSHAFQYFVAISVQAVRLLRQNLWRLAAPGGAILVSGNSLPAGIRTSGRGAASSLSCKVRAGTI